MVHSNLVGAVCWCAGWRRDLCVAAVWRLDPRCGGLTLGSWRDKRGCCGQLLRKTVSMSSAHCCGRYSVLFCSPHISSAGQPTPHHNTPTHLTRISHTTPQHTQPPDIRIYLHTSQHQPIPTCLPTSTFTSWPSAILLYATRLTLSPPFPPLYPILPCLSMPCYTLLCCTIPLNYTLLYSTLLYGTRLYSSLLYYTTPTKKTTIKKQIYVTLPPIPTFLKFTLLYSTAHSALLYTPLHYGPPQPPTPPCVCPPDHPLKYVVSVPSTYGRGLSDPSLKYMPST